MLKEKLDEERDHPVLNVGTLVTTVRKETEQSAFEGEKRYEQVAETERTKNHTFVNLQEKPEREDACAAAL